jgi:two-component system sensor kinase FixL
VSAGVIRSPYLVSLFFLAAVAAMGAELSHEVVRGARLSHELERSQHELHDSDARLRRIVDSAMDAIISLDESLRIVQFNAAAETMYRTSASDMLGQPVDRLIPDRLRERYRALIRDVGESRGRTDGGPRQVTGLRADGQEFPVEASVATNTTQRGMEITMILRDLTEQQRVKLEAQEARQDMAHLSRVALLNELSGSLAHELNQPLGAILNNAEAMRRLLGREDHDPDEMRQILEDIIADDKRAGEVIKRLRSLLRKGELQAIALELRDVVTQVLRVVHDDLAWRGVTVHTEFADDGARVMGDPIQLQQVMLNLLVNAGDAMADMPEEERMLTVRTERSEDGSVSVSVSDRGGGIPEDSLDEVFQPFYTTKARGLGMGLAVSHTIVEAHGGRLWAENNPDAGAALRFTLPMSK